MVNMLKVLIAVIVLVVIIGVAMLGKKLMRILRFKSATTPRNESIWLEAVAAALVAFIATAHYVVNEPDASWLMWLGIFVFFIGGLIHVLAKRQLHKEESFQELITFGFDNINGLYKRIRHPSKFALLLLLVGYSLALGSSWALGLVLIFFVPSLLFRISQEERALRDEFGKRWEEYVSTTKRLIPWVF